MIQVSTPLLRTGRHVPKIIFWRCPANIPPTAASLDYANPVNSNLTSSLHTEKTTTCLLTQYRHNHSRILLLMGDFDPLIVNIQFSPARKLFMEPIKAEAPHWLNANTPGFKICGVESGKVWIEGRRRVIR